jgi:transcriptional regulator with XRE-family HTH domain
VVVNSLLSHTFAVDVYEINAKLGRIIREKRESLRISQEGLAALSNLNRTYIGKIERGDVSPTIVTVQKLAKALNIRLSELMLIYEQDD